jgi:glucokinase
VTDLALAVDIGGTKMAAGFVDRSGSLQERARVPTHGDADTRGPEVLWRTLADLVHQVQLRVAPGDRVVVCGVGCGGPMSPDGETVSPLNIAEWRDFPLRARLHELTGVPTHVDNDAKALALGEGWVGAAAGRHDYMGIVGHVVVVPDGRRCACGGRGCLEAEASGTAIAALTGRPADVAPPYMVERTGTLVGRAVASVVNLLDLPLAVVSGSVALGFGPPFFEAAQREVDLRCRLDYARGARVVAGGLGDRGPLIGAGCVGWRRVEAPG